MLEENFNAGRLFASLPCAQDTGGENPYIDTKDVLKLLIVGDSAVRLLVTGVHLTGVYLMSVRLTGVCLIGIHLRMNIIAVYIMGVHLVGMYFIGVKAEVESDQS